MLIGSFISSGVTDHTGTLHICNGRFPALKSCVGWLAKACSLESQAGHLGKIYKACW